MLTTTETILFITVWTLTICGLFFGGRAKLRKRRSKIGVKPSPPSSPYSPTAS